MTTDASPDQLDNAFAMRPLVVTEVVLVVAIRVGSIEQGRAGVEGRMNDFYRAVELAIWRGR